MFFICTKGIKKISYLILGCIGVSLVKGLCRGQREIFSMDYCSDNIQKINKLTQDCVVKLVDHSPSLPDS